MPRHRGVAQRARVRSMGHDRVQYFVIHAVFAQKCDANARMFRLRWMSFPIEVMHQAREHPTLALGGSDDVGVCAHAGGDRFHVMAQRGIGHPLVHETACVGDVHGFIHGFIHGAIHGAHQMCSCKMCSSNSWRPLSTGHDLRLSASCSSSCSVASPFSMRRPSSESQLA